MIPDLINDLITGMDFLPLGIHEATWAEFRDVFGYTQQRKDLITGLYTAIKDLQSCGCKVIYPDGGFTTLKKLPPKDIDVCWDIAGMDLDKLEREHPVFFDESAGRLGQKEKYGCEFFSVDLVEGGTGKLDFFQQHYGTPKGILKINIENI